MTRRALVGLVLVVACSGDDDVIGDPDAPVDARVDADPNGCIDCDAPNDAEVECPSHLSPCGSVGDICVDAEDRCTCAVGSGLNWECEPVQCPFEDGTDGAPCGLAPLHCDTGFEDEGRRCVSPEFVWADCRYYHHGGSQPPNGCPVTPPTVGAPCCQGLGFGGPPLGCAYGADLYDCVGEHWALTAP